MRRTPGYRDDRARGDQGGGGHPQASIERQNAALETWLHEHAEQLESEVG